MGQIVNFQYFQEKHHLYRPMQKCLSNGKIMLYEFKENRMYLHI